MDQITLPAQLESLASIGEFVAAAARAAGFDEHAVWQVQLAVDEAATNVIQYAYGADEAGTITVEQELTNDVLLIRLRDTGRGFDPNDVPPPDMQAPLEERQVGGLGLYLMKRLMDEVTFQFDSVHGNTLTLARRRTPSPSNALILCPAGRLDAITAPDLLNQALNQAQPFGWQVVLDLEQVNYVNSSGLRMLLLLLRELAHQGGSLRICNLQPRVAEVFAMTGLDQVFVIDGSRNEALRKITRA